MNILIQDQLFPEVWELAFEFKKERNQWAHKIGDPEYWTEDVVRKNFESIKKIVNCLPVGEKEKENFHRKLENLKDRFYTEEEIQEFVEKQKETNQKIHLQV